MNEFRELSGAEMQAVEGGSPVGLAVPLLMAVIVFFASDGFREGIGTALDSAGRAMTSLGDLIADVIFLFLG